MAAVYPDDPKLAPVTVMLADPVDALFITIILLVTFRTVRVGASNENASVTLPT
jgi:hypothetical protein